jgi:CDP-paratose 2-epimerase
MSARAAAPLALITGGAGFIGTNLADRLLSAGQRVLIFDNLSRAGVRTNLHWLQTQHPDSVEVQVADIRDADAVAHAVERADTIYHFAAQVAVTTSLDDPVQDFEINTRGTLNVLEAMRQRRRPPPLVVTSTNKVYGALDDVQLTRHAQRYVPVSADLRSRGISESRSLDFHSPYGCSKGAADQYVLDYVRSYGLPALVFRMSCIYGPHQFGNEDQGWVAHFLLRARERQPIAIFGDGCQVRDVLYVEDLVDALTLASANVQRLKGQAFNIGGGPRNTLSLLELVDLMKERFGNRVDLQFSAWRRGDQRYYVTDTGRFEAATGWRPSVSPQVGLERLQEWLDQLTPVRRERTSDAPPKVLTL